MINGAGEAKRGVSLQPRTCGQEETAFSRIATMGGNNYPNLMIHEKVDWLGIEPKSKQLPSQDFAVEQPCQPKY